MSSVAFLYPLKTSENFRGYENVTLDINGLKEHPLKVFSKHLIVGTPLEGVTTKLKL